MQRPRFNPEKALATVLLSAALALGACNVQHESLSLNDPGSLQLTILSPSDLGTTQNPLPTGTPITFQVSAFHINGQPAVDFSSMLNLFAFYEGTLSTLGANSLGADGGVLDGGMGTTITPTTPDGGYSTVQ